jgi:hypothetical protein
MLAMLPGTALVDTLPNVAHRNRNGWMERGGGGDRLDGVGAKSYRGGWIPCKHKETQTIQKETRIARFRAGRYAKAKGGEG